jgi:hypothetical protein
MGLAVESIGSKTAIVRHPTAAVHPCGLTMI